MFQCFAMKDFAMLSSITLVIRKEATDVCGPTDPVSFWWKSGEVALSFFQWKGIYGISLAEGHIHTQALKIIISHFVWMMTINSVCSYYKFQKPKM